jgi:hypothetical protein
MLLAEKVVGRTSPPVLVTRECLLLHHLLNPGYLVPRDLALASMRQEVV